MLQVFDNVVLGAWVHKVRKLRKEKRLPAEQVRGPPAVPCPGRSGTALQTLPAGPGKHRTLFTSANVCRY